jgi:hypothetical protein
MWGLLVAYAALIIRSPAQGAVTHYTDRAQFEAAAGGVRRFDFETSGFPPAPTSISSFDDGRISVLSTLDHTGVWVPATLQVYPPTASNQVLTGARASPGLSNQSLRFGLNTPTHALGFDLYVGIADANEEVYVSLNGNVGSPGTPYVFRDRDGDISTPVFFGVLSDEPIRTVDIVAINPLVGAPFPVFMPHGVDNFTVATVPEPGGLVSGALVGTVGLLIVRQRRQSRDDPAPGVPGDVR